MKTKKNKLLGLLLMLACVFGLTACGGEAEVLKYDEEKVAFMVSNAYLLVSADYGDEVINGFDDYNDDQLDELAAAIKEKTGVRTEGSVFVKGVNSYNNALKELGEIQNLDTLGNGMKFDASADELIVTMPLSGSLHDGEFEVIFDKNIHVTSITTNVKYNMSESMQKAGQNTLIGMGTVFAMLILIMCIIYCFGFIPKIQKANEEKKKSKANTPVDNAIKGIVEREEAAIADTDDLELIAVISAAIAAAEGSSSTDGFVVRSIRRIR